MPLCRVRDASLSYLWLGGAVVPDRYPLVLVHGLGASLAFWYPAVAPVLAQTHRVLLFDLRGHGRSAVTRSGYAPADLAADMAVLFEQLDIGAVHLVGHSFGGAVALCYALQHPTLVESLTIVDARIRALQPQADPLARPIDQNYRQTLVSAGVDNDVERGAVGVELLTKMALARLRQPDAIARPARLLPSPFMGIRGKAAAQRWLDLVEGTSLCTDVSGPETLEIDLIAKFPFPVLLVYGEYTHAMRSAIAFQKLCRTAELEVVAGAGHFFPLTRPDALLGPLRRFLGVTAESP